eukprot:8803158-Karenia_brevis.AAC.1
MQSAVDWELASSDGDADLGMPDLHDDTEAESDIDLAMSGAPGMDSDDEVGHDVESFQNLQTSDTNLFGFDEIDDADEP